METITLGSVDNSSLKIVEEDLPADIKKMDCTVKYTDQSYSEYIEKNSGKIKKNIVFLFFKRLFDIVFSLIVLLVSSPLFLMVSIWIKLDSKGSVFFKQQRMGKNGKPFTCIKFRSMREDAPHEVATSKIISQESYMTRAGIFLRKCSLDELPQLYCCLIGTMSIVGARPVCLTEENLISMRHKLGVDCMRPGITGLSQVSGRDAVYYKNKAIIDSVYTKKSSLWFDFVILLKTVKIVFSRKDAK